MTVFGLSSQPLISDNRSWLAEDHGTEIAPGVAIDLTLFSQSQHYANGFIPSGCVVGKNTSSGKYGPYLGSANDGRQTAVGITLNPISVYQPGTITGALNVNVGVALLLHGFVNVPNLPFTSGNAAGGGYLDTAARTALKLIAFIDSPA
jgi:hypothetical protein